MNARRTYGVLSMLAGMPSADFAAVETPARDWDLERARILLAAQRARDAGFQAFSGALISLAKISVDTRDGGAQSQF